MHYGAVLWPIIYFLELKNYATEWVESLHARTTLYDVFAHKKIRALSGLGEKMKFMSWATVRQCVRVRP